MASHKAELRHNSENSGKFAQLVTALSALPDPGAQLSLLTTTAAEMLGFSACAVLLGPSCSAATPWPIQHAAGIQSEALAQLSGVGQPLTVAASAWASIAPLGTRATLATTIKRGSATVGWMVCFWTTPCDVAEQAQCLDPFAACALLILRGAEAHWHVAEATDAIRLEAQRARDAYLSVASHELRSPLTALQLQLQLVARRFERSLDDGPLRARLTQGVSKAVEQCRQLVRLGDSLLDLAQINAGCLRLNCGETDLSRLVEQTAERFALKLNHAGCRAVIEVEPNVVGWWDATRLDQITTNLLSNAIKYAAGTPITISVEADATHARLCVRDCGPGIHPDMHARLFERFERGASKARDSWGLGLYIVQNIVDAHKGTIHLDSQPSAGAAFTVQLPRQYFKEDEPP